MFMCPTLLLDLTTGIFRYKNWYKTFSPSLQFAVMHAALFLLKETTISNCLMLPLRSKAVFKSEQKLTSFAELWSIHQQATWANSLVFLRLRSSEKLSF